MNDQSKSLIETYNCLDFYDKAVDCIKNNKENIDECNVKLCLYRFALK